MFNRGNLITGDLAKIITGKAYEIHLIQNNDLHTDIMNFTFEAGSNCNWHKYSVGKTLLCTQGRGIYQEKGKDPVYLYPGVYVDIVENVEHWFGAQEHNQVSLMTISTTVNHKVEWLNAVSKEEYAAAQPKGPVSYNTFDTLFPMGDKNLPQYSKFFIGQSYLFPISTKVGLPVFNVTFEPACRNNWHSHAGGQILLCVAGSGLYQEKGKPAVHLTPGSVIEIPAGVVHWHGATQDSWLSHIAIECNPGSGPATWLDPVNDQEFKAAQPEPRTSSEVIERVKMFSGPPTSLNKYDGDYIPVYASFALGQIYDQTPLIDLRTRIIIVIASLITTQSHAELRDYLYAALNVLQPHEIKEIAYHCVPYVGFGKVRDSILIINEFFESQNIPVPRPQGTVNKENRLQKGFEAQGAIFGGIDLVRSWHENAPADLKHIQTNLTNNCFGDHYTRSSFDLATRELITYSILISHGGCEPQVKGHVNGNKLVGNGREYLIQATTSLLPYIGYPRTLNAINCINEIMPPPK